MHLVRWLAAAGLLAVSVSAHAAPAERKLLKNGDFEAGVGEWRVIDRSGSLTVENDTKVKPTPPDPQTESTSVELDPLAFVHAVVTQIPDARKHMIRYSGAYSHRFRGRVRNANVGANESAAPGVSAAPVTPAERGSPEAKRRSAWARVLEKVFEVDPLLCATCGTKMKVIAWITDPVVIERILTHRKKAGLESPFDARGPPTSAVSE